MWVHKKSGPLFCMLAQNFHGNPWLFCTGKDIHGTMQGENICMDGFVSKTGRSDSTNFTMQVDIVFCSKNGSQMLKKTTSCHMLAINWVDYLCKLILRPYLLRSDYVAPFRNHWNILSEINVQNCNHELVHSSRAYKLLEIVYTWIK